MRHSIGETSFADLFFSQSLNQTFNKRGHGAGFSRQQIIDIKHIINKLLDSTKKN